MKRISTIDRERDLILATLNQCGGSRAQVCKTLGIHRILLSKKLDQYAAQGFTVPPSPKAWIVRDAARIARKKATQFFCQSFAARVSSDNPRLKAFCRVAPSVLLNVRPIFAARVLLPASFFKVRTSFAVHVRLFIVRLLDQKIKGCTSCS
jgi:hypothetical protein